mmetsp:Transcript_104702/g.281365  ORF Transcript_104702/g.281365 Transcript_104702/m.281365 type:complete len:282 (-) Transcript_104702:8-853(-)
MRGVLGQARSNLAHLAGPRRCEQDYLLVLRQIFQHVPELGLEAHVQHPICLVQDQVQALPQLQTSVPQEVVHAARCRDHTMRAIPQPSDLGLAGRPTEDAGRLDLCWLPKCFGLLVDLLAELAGRRQDHHRRAIRVVASNLVRHLFSLDLDVARQQVTQSLAATSLGDTNDVLALHQDGPSPSLDRRWALEASIHEKLHQAIRELPTARTCVPSLPGLMLLAVDDSDLLVILPLRLTPSRLFRPLRHRRPGSLLGLTHERHASARARARARACTGRAGGND